MVERFIMAITNDAHARYAEPARVSLAVRALFDQAFLHA